MPIQILKNQILLKRTESQNLRITQRDLEFSLCVFPFLPVLRTTQYHSESQNLDFSQSLILPDLSHNATMPA